MGDFTLTQEQQACQKLVRDYVQKEIAPIAHELDEEQRHSHEIVEKYFEIGLLHFIVPEKFGSAGLKALDGCLLSEELAAAWLHDNGQRSSKESAIAIYFAGDTAMQVTTDVVQVMGGYGYMKEYPVEKFMRDTKLFQIYEGTNQIQRLVIAREMLRK